VKLDSMKIFDHIRTLYWIEMFKTQISNEGVTANYLFCSFKEA